MEKIISLFKYLIFLVVFLINLVNCIIICKNNIHKPSIEKDNDGIHRICRSNLEGKIVGRPCSMCRLKWNKIKEPIDIYDSILKYAEKKFGKNVKDFSNAEVIELTNMLPDVE